MVTLVPIGWFYLFKMLLKFVLSLACDPALLSFKIIVSVFGSRTISLKMPNPGDMAQENTSRASDHDESPVVNEGFSMFKNCL